MIALISFFFSYLRASKNSRSAGNNLATTRTQTMREKEGV